MDPLSNNRAFISPHCGSSALRPFRAGTIVLGAVPQHVVDDFVTEILGIGDSRRFLDLLTLLIELIATVTMMVSDICYSLQTRLFLYIYVLVV